MSNGNAIGVPGRDSTLLPEYMEKRGRGNGAFRQESAPAPEGNTYQIGDHYIPIGNVESISRGRVWRILLSGAGTVVATLEGWSEDSWDTIATLADDTAANVQLETYSRVRLKLVVTVDSVVVAWFVDCDVVQFEDIP